MSFRHTSDKDSYFTGKEKYRGIALVIGNEKFDQPSGKKPIDREGCEKDITMMKSMFEKLDFFVECFKDFTAQEMRKKIEEASQDKRNKESQCFVLGISTHGKETLDKKNNVWQHEILGTDRNPVMVEEILDMFDEKNATGLKDKPKIVFIQACRYKVKSKKNDRVDGGMDANIMKSESSNFYEKEISEFDEKNFNDNCDNIYADWVRDKRSYDPSMPNDPGSQLDPSSSDRLPEANIFGDGGGTTTDTDRSTDSGNTPQDQFDVLSVKCPKDCLIYYPVESDKWAFRDTENGSFMIQSMYQQLPKLLKGYRIIEYLTYVNMALSKYTVPFEKKDVKITGSYITRMNKHVVFEPLTKNSPMAKAIEIVKKSMYSDLKLCE